jgi:DNA-binding LacI/PurR family transcriptional regulator
MPPAAASAAAADLGYVGPDPMAASLRRGRSGIVGVVVGSNLNDMFRDPVQRLLMDGLAEASRRAARDCCSCAATRPWRTPTLMTAPLDAAVLIGCDGPLRDSLNEAHLRVFRSS